MATPNQVKIIYTLLGENNLRDEKESIVQAFSGGKTTSVRALRNAEAFALISHLKSMDLVDTRATKMRNKILSMAHEMGWNLNPTLSKTAGSVQVKAKIDMEHVNNWCLSHSYLHKALDKYEYQELPKLVTQFENMYRGHVKSI